MTEAAQTLSRREFLRRSLIVSATLAGTSLLADATGLTGWFTKPLNSYGAGTYGGRGEAEKHANKQTGLFSLGQNEAPKRNYGA